MKNEEEDVTDKHGQWSHFGTNFGVMSHGQSRDPPS